MLLRDLDLPFCDVILPWHLYHGCQASRSSYDDISVVQQMCAFNTLDHLHSGQVFVGDYGAYSGNCSISASPMSTHYLSASGEVAG